jgi:hypothetical protein
MFTCNIGRRICRYDRIIVLALPSSHFGSCAAEPTQMRNKTEFVEFEKRYAKTVCLFFCSVLEMFALLCA